MTYMHLFYIISHLYVMYGYALFHIYVLSMGGFPLSIMQRSKVHDVPTVIRGRDSSDC